MSFFNKLAWNGRVLQRPCSYDHLGSKTADLFGSLLCLCQTVIGMKCKSTTSLR